MLIVLTLGATFLGFLSVFWLTPFGVPSLRKRANGQMPLDLRCRYSPEETYALIDVYGVTGIAHWRRLLLIDMGFPVVYAAFFAAIGAFWVGRGNAGEDWRVLILLLSAAAALSDYLENVCLLYILKILPRRTHVWARRASMFTSTKFFFLASTLIVGISYWILFVIAQYNV